jgi:hypothetical protein
VRTLTATLPRLQMLFMVKQATDGGSITQGGAREGAENKTPAEKLDRHAEGSGDNDGK